MNDGMTVAPVPRWRAAAPSSAYVDTEARLAVPVTKSTAQTTLSFGISLASQLDPKLASSIQSQTVKWS
jgi:hypothetical protein